MRLVGLLMESSSVAEMHPLYLTRLASVFLEKYDRDGADTASAWFLGFLDEPHRHAVRPYIKKLIQQKEKNNGNE